MDQDFQALSNWISYLTEIKSRIWQNPARPLRKSRKKMDYVHMLYLYINIYVCIYINTYIYMRISYVYIHIYNYRFKLLLPSSFPSSNKSFCDYIGIINSVHLWYTLTSVPSFVGSLSFHICNVVFIYIDVWTYLYFYRFIYMYVYVHMYIYIYTRIYTYTYMYWLMFLLLLRKK